MKGKFLEFAGNLQKNGKISKITGFFLFLPVTQIYIDI